MVGAVLALRAMLENDDSSLRRDTRHGCGSARETWKDDSGQEGPGNTARARGRRGVTRPLIIEQPRELLACRTSGSHPHVVRIE